MPQEDTQHVTVPLYAPTGDRARMTLNLTSIIYERVLICARYNGSRQSCRIKVSDVISYEDVFTSELLSMDELENGINYDFRFVHMGRTYAVTVTAAESSPRLREPRSVYLVEHQEQFGKWVNVAAFYNMNLATEHKNEILARFFAEAASEDEISEVFGEGYEPDGLDDDAYLRDARGHVEQIENWQRRYMDFGCYRVREVQVKPGGIS